VKTEVAQNAKQALADLEKGKAWPVYYLYGEEPFKINEFIEKATAILFGEKSNADEKANTDLSFCVDRIDGATLTGSDVLEAVQSMGLFGASSGRRLVLVRQAHQLKEIDSLSNALTESKDGAPFGDNVLILAADSLDGRRKFHQWLKKKGYALEFKPARDAELSQWVRYLAKKAGAKVTPEAADILGVLSDGSLYRLAQEIEKAWLYAGAQPDVTLTPEHIAAVSSNQVTHEMIELVQAILEGKRTRALLLTEKLVRSPEDALGLVGFLTWAIKNPGRGFQGTIRGGEKRAREFVGALIDLDQRLKSSGLDHGALVEQFVIERT
jgi:DNA polymerase-3 subunit delta